MSYINTLNAEQKRNADILVKRMIAKGITNPYTQSAILAVVSKESAFIPKNEGSYRTTNNARIRSIFSKLSKLNDAELNALKSNDEAFFNAIYGGMYGNAQNEGYKYRGRGFQQLTFKGNYKAVGDKIGVDLVSNPDKLNDPTVAADAVIEFFKDQIEKGKKLGKLSAYNATNINDFKNETDSLNAIYHANAGWGKSSQVISADVTGGKAKATSRMSDILNFVKNTASSGLDTATEVVKKNPITMTVVMIAAIAVASYFIYKATKKK